MVIVFPNGSINGDLQRVPSSERDPFIPELMTVIIPYVEANYRVSKSPEDRALACLSMGGGQTAFIGRPTRSSFATSASSAPARPIERASRQSMGRRSLQEAAASN